MYLQKTIWLIFIVAHRKREFKISVVMFEKALIRSDAPLGKPVLYQAYARSLK